MRSLFSLEMCFSIKKHIRKGSACVLPQALHHTPQHKRLVLLAERIEMKMFLHGINWLCKTWLQKLEVEARMEAKRIINEVKKIIYYPRLLPATAISFFFYHQSFQHRNAQPVLFLWFFLLVLRVLNCAKLILFRASLLVTSFHRRAAHYFCWASPKRKLANEY